MWKLFDLSAKMRFSKNLSENTLNIEQNVLNNFLTIIYLKRVIEWSKTEWKTKSDESQISM